MMDLWVKSGTTKTSRKCIRKLKMPELSIVIAAYNEERRLPKTLKRLFQFLQQAGVTYEVIIIDDGSRDRTRAVIEEIALVHPEVRLFSHFPNRGRGFSIKEGVLAARGGIILETDADLSVAPEAIMRGVGYFREHSEVDVIIGSRQLSESKILLPQPFLRAFLGYGFWYLARVLIGPWWITDFTLGFKMFRKDAAHDIFLHQFDNYYVAEAEIVYIAHKRGWKIQELPVTWTDHRDSRVHPFYDSIRSFKGVLQILWRSVRGRYN